MSATRSARVATSRSWARVFSSWVPKMAGRCTSSRGSAGHAAQFSAYLRSMFRRCLLAIGVVLGASAPAAGQHADTLRDRLEARIARAPAQAVGVYYQSLARPDSILIGANLRLHAASTMKVPVMVQIFRDADSGLLALVDSLTVHTAFPSLVPGGAFTVGKEDDSDSTLYALAGRNRSVRELLELMITRSSNLATNILIERVGATRAQAAAPATRCSRSSAARSSTRAFRSVCRRGRAWRTRRGGSGRWCTTTRPSCIRRTAGATCSWC